MGRGGAEQHAVGHDHRASTAHAEHTEHEREEQKLGLLGLADLQKVSGDGIIVQTALEGGIGQDQGILLLVGVLVGEAVAVLDIGVVHAVGHHVHGADAEHGTIHIVAVEHAVHVVGLLLAVEEDFFLAFLFEVVPGRHQKARRTAGGVADDLVGGGVHQLHHHTDDVTGGAELTVQTRLGDLGEQILVHVAANIAVLDLRHLGIDIVQRGNHLVQHQGRGDLEDGIVHILGVCAVLVIVEVLDEGEHPLLHGGVHLGRGVIVEHRPFELVSVDLAVTDLHLVRKNALVREAKHDRLLGAEVVGIVEVADEHQVRDLLDNVQGIDQSACRKYVPKAVDSVFEFACDHMIISFDEEFRQIFILYYIINFLLCQL